MHDVNLPAAIWRRILLCWVLLLAAPTAAAAEPRPELGRHFILLIDDSGDMNGFAQSVRQGLPEIFFAEGKNRPVTWPAFDPQRDVLSAFFFTIHAGGPADECKQAGRRFSALPEAMFQQAWFADGGPTDIETFRKSLNQWLDLPCRWKGKFSPIITAPPLALPLAARNLDRAARFSSIVLVVATNDFFSTALSPAVELRNFQRNEDGKFLADIEAAERELARILPRFRFDLPEDWSYEVTTTGRPLYVRAFRVQPVAPTPEALVAVSPQIDLDRIATSSQEIKWQGARLGADELRLTAADGLVPVRLDWRVHDGQARPWVLGKHQIPAQWQSGELSHCDPPPCVVPLAQVLNLPAMAPGDPVPESLGVLELQVEFQFNSAGLYDFLYPRTATERIELRPAPAQALPATWLESARPITNRVLTGLWRPRDRKHGLTQSAALDRLYAERERRRLFLTLGALTLGALVVFVLFRTAYQRLFRPALNWQPAGPISLDLSQPGASRLLVGTVGIVNQGHQPWFGRLLRHNEQPTRQETLALDPIALEPQGFRVSPGAEIVAGFLRSEQAQTSDDGEVIRGDAIVPAVRRSVSHGQRVPVFIATEALADFERPGGEVAETTVEIGSAVRLVGSASYGDTGTAVTAARFEVRVLPEVATAPKIWFEPAAGRLEFRQGEEVEVGCFVFASLARHRFALPFESDYELEVLRDRAPMGGRAMRLADSRIRVASGERRRVSVLLSCDGELVRNPEPSQQSYSVHLLGPGHADSQQGPHEIAIHRDSTRAEAEIRVSYLQDIWDLHRTSAGDIVLRCTKTGRTVRAVGGALELDGNYTLRIPPTPPPPMTLATLCVGNSGRSGRGRVTLEVRRQLDLDADIAGCLHLRDDIPTERLLVCSCAGEDVPFDGTLGQLHVVVAEGEEPQERVLKLDGELVERIDGARLPAEKVRVILQLSVHVADDQGTETAWQVDLVAHLSVEKLPGLNWLCIDFGTSAIAAAIGRADGDLFHRLDLQHREVVPGQSLATQDVHNLEQGSPFLPSWLICDGDLRHREVDSSATDWPAGFPLHRTTSLNLREPSFVGLPALLSHLTERPGRLVFSLKQWLARLAPTVRFQDPVTFRTADGEVQIRRQVPLDELLEATLAALVVSYLQPKTPDGNREVTPFEADQVVLTHPNTFTARHRERFHRIASRVLQPRLGLASPEHITLVSESDAVAYQYCVRALETSAPLLETERILVYDFGAGTLDLSLVRVEWKRDRRQPRSWTIEARLGLPLAGNHIDEILMRMVDKQLRRPEVLQDTGTEYRYPAVARQPVAGDLGHHRAAVLKTWAALRKAKHDWNGEAGFELTVGEPGGLGGVLLCASDQYRQLPAQPPADEAALFLDGSRIRLSIPAARVRSDPRLREFLQLVTDDAIGELLTQAALGPEAINTLLVSGRGALWPGLQGRVQALLPHAVLAEPGGALERKDVVPRGAIALQALRHQLDLRVSDRARPRLGVLLGQRHLVVESEWADGHPVDLSGCDEFRLVQVGLCHPDAERDLRTLRRYFYVDLMDAPIRRQVLWQDDPRLFLEIRERGGHLQISLKNSFGQAIDVNHASSPAGAALVMPWPMGSFLLEPET